MTAATETDHQAAAQSPYGRAGQTTRPLTPVDKAGYVASQAARVAWYAAHYAVLRRLTPVEMEKPGEPPYQPKAAPPDRAATRRAFMALFEGDLANIEAGLYPAPRDLRLSPRRLLRVVRDSQRFLADAPKVAQRRQDRGRVDVREDTRVDRSRYPTYYLQNFHYQTDGWLSAESAQLYDTQVEVLFTGAADAMRRLVLADLARELQGRDQRTLQVLDLACGAGRFLEQVLDAYPRVQATGVDLSSAYLEQARARLRAWPHVRCVEANAEATGFDAASFDVVTCIYLFHELPPRVRPGVAAEMARLIKPGGCVVFADSIQTGDDPNLDLMLEQFPRLFHEPYYAHYASDDLHRYFEDAGLVREQASQGFLTKSIVYRKPQSAPASR